MSRLDSAIRRLTAQRACLEHALALIADVPGPILELGLGNGRTFDHLRARAPGRDIYVFEREVRAHPDCVPDADRLFVGDLRETLPRAAARLGRQAALAHGDLGSGRRDHDAALSRFVAANLPALLKNGAVVVSDQALDDPRLRPVAPPSGIAGDRYYIYRSVEAGSDGRAGNNEG